MMDAVDSTGRTITPGDTVRYRHDRPEGLLREVRQLCHEQIPTWRAVRGRGYRPVYLDGRGWVCPHDCTIKVSAELGLVA